jgi:hypothetical protein
VSSAEPEGVCLQELQYALRGGFRFLLTARLFVYAECCLSSQLSFRHCFLFVVKICDPSLRKKSTIDAGNLLLTIFLETSETPLYCLCVHSVHGIFLKFVVKFHPSVCRLKIVVSTLRQSTVTGDTCLLCTSPCVLLVY